MKRGIFLYGINCTLDVWDEIRDAFDDIDATFVEYPHRIIQNAHTISDITNWVYTQYGKEQFDFIIGYSMGGLIALELVANCKMRCDTVIFIESNLRPAKEFYRNLMLPVNMIKYGDKVKDMFKGESPFYTDDLKASVQADFDFSPYINEIPGKVFGIYGDRGMEHYSRRIADLCLDKAVKEKINFKFVRASCHMPMIENPQELVSILRTCLK